MPIGIRVIHFTIVFFSGNYAWRGPVQQVYIRRRLPVVEGNITDEYIEKLAPWDPDVKEMCGRAQI